MAVELIVMWAARGAVRAIALHRGVVIQVAEDADGQDRWILEFVMRRCASLGIAEEIVPRRATGEDVAAWEAFCGRRRDIPPTTPTWRRRKGERIHYYERTPRDPQPRQKPHRRDVYTVAANTASGILGIRHSSLTMALRLVATGCHARAAQWADDGTQSSADLHAERSRCLSLAYRLLGDEETGLSLALRRCGGGKQGRAKRLEFVDRCSRNMGRAVAAVREILGGK